MKKKKRTEISSPFNSFSYLKSDFSCWCIFVTLCTAFDIFLSFRCSFSLPSFNHLRHSTAVVNNFRFFFRVIPEIESTISLLLGKNDFQSTFAAKKEEERKRRSKKAVKEVSKFHKSIDSNLFLFYYRPHWQNKWNRNGAETMRKSESSFYDKTHFLLFINWNNAIISIRLNEFFIFGLSFRWRERSECHLAIDNQIKIRQNEIRANREKTNEIVNVFVVLVAAILTSEQTVPKAIYLYLLFRLMFTYTKGSAKINLEI